MTLATQGARASTAMILTYMYAITWLYNLAMYSYTVGQWFGKWQSLNPLLMARVVYFSYNNKTSAGTLLILFVAHVGQVGHKGNVDELRKHFFKFRDDCFHIKLWCPGIHNESDHVVWLVLIYLSLVTHICVTELGHHCFTLSSYCLVGAKPLPKLILIYFNWTLQNKLANTLNCDSWVPFNVYRYHCRPWHNFNKTFRERQHPRPAEIRKCEHKLSEAISNSDSLHDPLLDATKFQAVMWFPHIS